MKFEKSRLEPLKIDIGGIEYPVRVTFGGMAELEEILGTPFLEIFNKFIVNTFNANETMAVMYVMLKGGGVEVTLEELKDAEFTADILGVMSDALMRANKVITALDEQQETEDGADKKKTKKKTKTGG